MNLRYRNAALICLALLIAGGLLAFRFRTGERKSERIEYVVHQGDDPTIVEMNFSAPSTDLSQVAISPVIQEFATGELLSIQGAVVIDPKQDLMPLVASLVLHTKDGDVTVNMGQLGPPYDPGNVAIPINCPPKPGKYSLYIVWGAATSYIAHAEVIVVPR